MVEFSGDDAAEVSYRVHELSGRLGSAVGMIAASAAARRGDCATRSGTCAAPPMPLLYGMPGDRKPVTFVEDCRGRSGAAAGVRRPLPRNLPPPRHRRRVLRPRQRRLPAHPPGAEPEGPGATWRTMRRITEDVTDLVLEFDGIAQRRARRRPGAQRVEPQDVRPGGLRGVPPGQARLRPGRTCSTPARSSMRRAMTENLRYPPAECHCRPADGASTTRSRTGSSARSSCATARASAARRRAGRCAPLPRHARREGHDACAGQCLRFAWRATVTVGAEG